MKEVEDRKREDAYHGQELDGKLMDAAKLVSAGVGARCEDEEVSTLRGYSAVAGEVLWGISEK